MCRHATALTSGYHPEPDPDRFSPGGPDLREPDSGLSAPPAQAIRPLATWVQRASLK